MPKSTTFSTRSNAKRAAEKAIRDGSAPSIDYGIKPNANDRYRFDVVWLTKGGTQEVPTTDQVEGEIDAGLPSYLQGLSEDQLHNRAAVIGGPASANLGAHIAAMKKAGNDQLITGDELQERFDSWEFETAEAAADTSVDASDGEQTMADRFPPGTRVIVQESKRKRRTGVVDYRVDATCCRVHLDGPMPSELFRYSQLSLDDGSEPLLPAEKLPRKPRAAPAGDRKPSKSSVLDAQAATGAMPAKPIITSAANQKQYQPRFDKLEAMAMVGDWDGVRGYEVKGINSYAKMVKQYRARLLAAHAASVASAEAA
jgi:hypothetical protein